MPGIRTAESHYLGENAEIVPEMIASPALEQQNLIIRWEMLSSAGDGSMCGIRTAESRHIGKNAERVP